MPETVLIIAQAPGKPHGSRPSLMPTCRQVPDRRNHASRDKLLEHVRAEFNELPGLKLTLAQAKRLFDVRDDVCLRVLHSLVGEGLLHATSSLFLRRAVDLARENDRAQAEGPP